MNERAKELLSRWDALMFDIQECSLDDDIRFDELTAKAQDVEDEFNKKFAAGEFTWKDFPERFITVYMPIAGWKAKEMRWFEEDNMYDNWQTDDFAYSRKEQAVRSGKHWAHTEGLLFIDTCPDETGDAPDKSVTEQLVEAFGGPDKVTVINLK